VFLSPQVHNICFHKYTPLSHFIKWNEIVFFPNILPRLYSNIICKNIGKFFQKFEMGYIQTCTPLESSTMWHPKGGHRSVLWPYPHYPSWHFWVWCHFLFMMLNLWRYFDEFRLLFGFKLHKIPLLLDNQAFKGLSLVEMLCYFCV
jgi:hypothetical protein